MIGGGVEQSLPVIKTGCGHHAGAHEITDGHAAATGLQAKPGKALEHDASEIGEVADDEGESADVERLLAQALQHIRSEEHTYELQSLMRISYADFCLQQKN